MNVSLCTGPVSDDHKARQRGAGTASSWILFMYIELSEKNTQHYIWRKKYGGGSIMIWGCFAGKMNSQVYHGVLWDNVRVAVGKLKLRASWVM
uniref:Uncharacterized protein n=1 Tax=Monopterus albus TaxID=43700 RepID=A0A3Q3R1V1_MONAL